MYNSRVQLKIDTTANWEKAVNFVPLKGEAIVYKDTDQTRLKIGDGTTLVNNLDFIGGGEEIDISGYLPLTAGEENKLVGPLGLTNEINYGTILPENPFEGQLFFLEGEEPDELFPGGTAGQVLLKNSDADGDISWGNIVALPEGGQVGQLLTKNSSADGDASWKDFELPEAYELPVASTQIGGIKSGTDITVDAEGNVSVNDDSHNHVWANVSDAGTLSINTTGTIQATKVRGAVWNDYAEYRAGEDIKPGYCVRSADSGRVSKTTEMFAPCDGIVSDTFGFAIGETNESKIPLAVAGRVLAYYSGNREDYHAGDTVCAGPNGLVYKMTREEIREWPDRIIGIVSEIPMYETWGSDNIKVNNRIWIKIR